MILTMFFMLIITTDSFLYVGIYSQKGMVGDVARWIKNADEVRKQCEYKSYFALIRSFAMMSHFAITADEVNKILAQANFLTRDVDGQRYEAEKWSQLFAKLPRECVKKILEEHECKNNEKDLADLAAESIEKSNAIYETIAEYMKTYAGQDADMPNAAMTKTVRLIKVLESCEAADVKGFFRFMDASSLTKFLQNKFGFPLRVTTGGNSTDAGFLVHDILDMESTAVLSGLRHYFEIQVVEDVSSPVRMDKEVLNDPSDSTNVIVKLHIFDKLPNVKAKGARTWVKNLPQIKNAGFNRKISKVSSNLESRLGSGQTLGNLEDRTKFVS